MSIQVPRKKVDEFADMLAFLAIALKEELAVQLAAIDFTLPVAEVRDELIEVMDPFCEASAQTSSAVAANFYEEVRAISLGSETVESLAATEKEVPAPVDGKASQRQPEQPTQPQLDQISRIMEPLSKEPAKQPDGFRAVAGDFGYDQRATESFIRDSVQHVADEGEAGADKVKREMQGRVGYQVKKSAGETIVVNGMRDSQSVRYARVPRPTKSYEDGCLFCQMLASRGFVYHTEGLAGLSSHYHDGCACMVVPGFGDNPKVEGYDPMKYKAASKEWQSRDHSQWRANVKWAGRKRWRG